MINSIIRDIQEKGWSFQKEVIPFQRLPKINELFNGKFSPAKVGKDQQLKRAEEIRGDWISWLDPLNPPQEIVPEVDFLKKLKQELNYNFYLGLKDFECHLAKYPAGSFYKKHSDRFQKEQSRSFTFIFYVHESWGKNDGGELVIYNKSDELVQTILPLPGSMVCFVSEDFPHEVLTCQRERRSLTGWMHTKLLT